MDSEIDLNKLKNCFRNIKDNIKLVFVFETFIITATECGHFYEFNKNLETLLVFNNNQNIESYLKSKILNELHSEGVIDFKSNERHVIARTKNGLYCWKRKQLSMFNSKKKPLTQYLSGKHIIDICCGAYHSLALTNSGQVYAWGRNSDGQIGNASNDNQLIPIELNAFNGEEVIQISCGGWHSMALTKSGRVFSWGSNQFGQLGRNNTKNSNKPSIVSLNNKISIKKISCGRYHSLLLSQNGDIYWFGFNGIETQITHKKLTKNSNKFIDIASHYDNDICIAQTEHWVYFWGKCKGVNEETDIISSKELIETNFKTIEEFYNNFLGITHKPIDKLIDFKIKMQLIENGIYKATFEELEELGEGRYGKVFEVKRKSTGDKFAIKRMEFGFEVKAKLLEEVRIFNTIECTFYPKIVQFFRQWLEDNDNKGGLILYTLMEKCDTTLKIVIDEIFEDSFICQNETLTLLGFYIASYIFVKILNSVNCLHKGNPQIFHCDLHSGNILFKVDYDEEEKKYKISIRIVDFGFAKIHELTQKSQTVLPKSSSKYCLPQVSSDGSYTLKNDIYALADIWTQLFCIDLFREYSDEENESSLLMSKYRNAKLLIEFIIEKMTETDDKIDCEEILSKKNDWALNDNVFNEFNAKEEFEKYLNPVLNPNQKKESFVYSIITFLYNQLIDNEKPDKTKKLRKLFNDEIKHINRDIKYFEIIMPKLEEIPIEEKKTFSEMVLNEVADSEDIYSFDGSLPSSDSLSDSSSDSTIISYYNELIKRKKFINVLKKIFLKATDSESNNSKNSYSSDSLLPSSDSSVESGQQSHRKKLKTN